MSEEDRTPHRSRGTPIELGQPRGERGKKVRRDENEGVLEKLFVKDLIGQPEYDAGLEYHKYLRKAASGASIPDVGRIPGQGAYDSDAMQCEAVIWVEKVNGKIIEARGLEDGRRFARVLSFALHPWSHMNLSEIDAAMKLPERKMRGRALLIDALGEIAEILGYASAQKGASHVAHR